jgi:hypothetical protein
MSRIFFDVGATLGFRSLRMLAANIADDPHCSAQFEWPGFGGWMEKEEAYEIVSDQLTRTLTEGLKRRNIPISAHVVRHCSLEPYQWSASTTVTPCGHYYGLDMIEELSPWKDLENRSLCLATNMDIISFDAKRDMLVSCEATCSKMFQYLLQEDKLPKCPECGVGCTVVCVEYNVVPTLKVPGLSAKSQGLFLVTTVHFAAKG